MNSNKNFNNTNKTAYQTPRADSDMRDYGFVFAMKKRSRKKALRLCIFFGIFGAHKFYDGDRKNGYLYLCTLGLFFIGWIKDIIAISRLPKTYYVR